MSETIILTPHQCDAVSAALEALEDRVQVFAIRGLAGTGKTTLIAPLRDLLRSRGLESSVGSPTHRAAMILRSKGIPDASTVHSLALTPYFQGDYAWAHRWLGEDCPAHPGAIDERSPDVEGLPFLIHRALARTGGSMRTLRGQATRYSVKKALAAIGLHGKQFFDGFGPREGEGVLIIDEASMVGEAMLALCLEAFPQVLLIGDPGQLPPVGDAATLADAPGVDLTEIHRQAAGNPIITLAYAARNGEANWRKVPKAKGHVEEVTIADASHFLTSPLIVWRNKTRTECTARIRDMLGYPADQVAPGEPLVCRATSAEDRAEGFINNTLWRVVGRSERDPRRVTVQEDGSEGSSDVLLHLEELDGEDIDPDSVPFRFGYCLTAHTAQGGEWPRVYISKPDLLAYQGFCKTRETDDGQRWAYTAITRAKETVVFLTKDLFAAPKAREESAMPVTMQIPEDAPANDAVALAPLDATPGIPDDIPEPMVPPGTVEPAAANGAVPPLSTLPPAMLPMLTGVCQYMQAQIHRMIAEEHHHWLAGFDGVLVSMRDHMREVLQGNEHSQYSLADALGKLADKGLPLITDGYQIVLHAVTPAGLPMTLTVKKPTGPELVEALTNLEAWLGENGYTALHIPSLHAA
jgi:exodeoxyribonuclease V